MRIAFVLPGPARVPMGGVAVVYRHAEALATRGHEVALYLPTRPGGRLRALAVGMRDRLHGVTDHQPYSAEEARRVLVPRVDRNSVEPQDVIVATGYQTVPWVERLDGERGQPVLFAQHDERELASRKAERWWASEMPRIAVSEWLCQRLRSGGKRCLGVAPNAVDPTVFGVDRPIPNRGNSVVALYHRHPSKGPKTLIEALHTIRRLRPSSDLTIIAARRPSHRVPEGVRVIVRPTRPELRAVFNRSAVVLHASRIEGWGLVPMEAAACGCAVVATDSLGPREYLRPGRSMVEVPVGDGETLGREAVRVLSDPPHRVRLAEAALEDVARFTWEASHDRLESLLVELVGTS